jgi:hypothetical protein
MRKILAAGVAALTVGATAASVAAPTAADAAPYHGYYGHYHHNDGAAVAAGIAGLAIGAAIASDHPHYYSYGYGPPAYYGPGPYYGGYYGTCVVRHWAWDPYIGRNVLVHERVPC